MIRLLRTYHAVQAVLVAGWWGLLLGYPAAAPFFFPDDLPPSVWRAVLVPDALVLVVAGGCMAWRPRPALGWFLVGAWTWSTLLCVGWWWAEPGTWPAVGLMAVATGCTAWLAGRGEHLRAGTGGR